MCVCVCICICMCVCIYMFNTYSLLISLSCSTLWRLLGNLSGDLDRSFNLSEL